MLTVKTACCLAQTSPLRRSSTLRLGSKCLVPKRGGRPNPMVQHRCSPNRTQKCYFSEAASEQAAAAAAETIPEPSMKTLQLVALTQAIPFIGFGFMDNAILIVAGDAIDTSLGIWLGISTLCAAAIGNIISDLAGIGLGTVIEDFCANVLRLPTPDITAAQRTLRSVRTASNLGMAVGMTFGCVVGMFPLLLIDTTKIERMKKQAHLECLFRDVITEAKTLIGAESTCLYLRVHKDDARNKRQQQGQQQRKANNFLSHASEAIRPSEDGEYLYAMYYVVPGSTSAVKPPTTTGAKDSEGVSIRLSDESRLVPIGKGIISRAIMTGDAWNIHNVQGEPDYLPEETHDGSVPDHLKHMLVVPVLDRQGKPIAVIRALNKVDDADGFSDRDVQVLSSLASHVSVNLQTVFRDEEEDEMRLRDTIRILHEHGHKGIGHSSTSAGMTRRRPALFPTDDGAVS